MKAKSIVMAFAIATAGVCFADEFTVAKDGSGDFTTIQEAVDAASAGDTIWVKPGVYDQGGKTYGDGFVDRVYIDKRLNIIATSADPADTVIKGAKDADHLDTYGIGPKAVRCIRMKSSTDVRGTIVKGFTFADGASPSTDTTDVETRRCGGFAGPELSGAYDTYLVDCVITNCVGTYGGAIRYATAVRCKVTDCETLVGNAGARNANLFHSVVMRSSSLVNCVVDSRLVNSIVVENYGSVGATAPATVSLYNSILQCNAVTYAYQRTTSSASLFEPVVTELDADDGSSVTSEARPFVAPLRGDYRLRAGTVATTIGKRSNLTAVIAAAGLSDIPEAAEINKSMDGVVLDLDSPDPICAGPYQKPVVVATGAQLFTAPMLFEGYEGKVGNLYAHSLTTPAVLQAKAVSKTGRPIFRYGRDKTYGDEYFPDLNEVVTLGYPPVGVTVQNKPWFAEKVWYVNPDPTVGKDDVTEEGRGLSAEKPFETIQYAIDQYAAAGEVILCAEGTYAKGGSIYTAGGTSNRVQIVSKYVRIKGAGKGKSIIQGCKNETDPRGDGSYCGPGAMRCVYLNAEAAVQGFTLQGGRSGYNANDKTGNIDANRGGLGYGVYERSSFLDCEFKDGMAYRGGFLFGTCKAIRCVFHDGKPLSGGLTATGPRLYSCLVYGNHKGGFACDISTHLYHVTGVATQDKSEQNYILSTNGGLSPTNCIFVGETYMKDNITSLGKSRGTILHGFGTITTTSGEYITDDPMFVDLANGDYRVSVYSPALTCSILPDDWWKLPVTDYEGRSFRFVDGKPVAGALHDVLSAVVVAKPLFGSVVSCEGTNYVAAGESLTVTVEDPDPASRPVKGYRLNGEEHLGVPVSYTFAAPSDGTPVVAEFEPLYLSDWYVDAAKIDDSGDGFTPETAKKTLTAAMSLPLLSGDMVHVAAGTYSEEQAKATWTGANDAPSRVCVPSGVTLLGDAGAEETVISGGEGIRCVTLQKGATVRGFTLTGAYDRTTYASAKDEYFRGGGVCAPLPTAESEYAYVCDCVLSNNVWGIGGGSYGGVLRNCRVVGNEGWRTSGAFYGMYAYGCYVNGNINGSNELCSNPYGVANCTIDSGNFQSDGKTENMRNFKSIKSTCVFSNCLLLGKLRDADISGSENPFVATNCIFVTGKANKSLVVDLGGCQWIASVAAAKLTADKVPEKDSPAVDKGDNAGMPEALTTDLSGGQRIYNGKVDIGAFEYDWRGDFAADLGEPRLTVAAASPMTVETSEGKVLVKDGALDLTMAGFAPRKARYAVPVEVTGTGALSVSLNGEELAVLTSADGPQTIAFRNNLAENALEFAYAPGEDDAGGALFGTAGVTPPPGAVLIVR